jgi:hypothetical protein
MYTGVAGALGAIAVQFVAPDSFTVVPVDHASSSASSSAGWRSISRRDLRRDLHPVRSQPRRPDLQGGALGDLRHLPDHVDVRRCPPAWPADPDHPCKACARRAG